MFSFFTKKEFLVDYLGGFVDIHNHILPGIDDGAKNLDESIGLIRAFSEFGVKDFICTPHIMHNYYENNPTTIADAHHSLIEKLDELEISDVSIGAAAEHMIDDNFENILEEGLVMPLGKNHLLIEMSFLQPSINFNDAVKKIQGKGMFPVLAHPERYAYYHQDFGKYEYFKSLGIKFQLNMLSLTDYYGKEVKRMALKLLERNMYDFIGSDVHHKNHISYLKNIKINSKQIVLVKDLLSAQL